MAYNKNIKAIWTLVIWIYNFKIPSFPPTTSKSIRFPNDIIKKIESNIEEKDCNFSEFVVEAVRVALLYLDESKEKGEQ